VLLLRVLVVVRLGQYDDPAEELARFAATRARQSRRERELVPLHLVHAGTSLELEAEVVISPRGIALQVGGDEGQVSRDEALAALHPERRDGQAGYELPVSPALGAHVGALRFGQFQLAGVVEVELDRVETPFAGVRLGLLVAAHSGLAADHEHGHSHEQQQHRRSERDPLRP
jgi:hypothetical protein